MGAGLPEQDSSSVRSGPHRSCKVLSARAGSSVGTSVRLKSGRSAVRPRPCPRATKALTACGEGLRHVALVRDIADSWWLGRPATYRAEMGRQRARVKVVLVALAAGLLALAVPGTAGAEAVPGSVTWEHAALRDLAADGAGGVLALTVDARVRAHAPPAVRASCRGFLETARRLLRLRLRRGVRTGSRSRTTAPGSSPGSRSPGGRHPAPRATAQGRRHWTAPRSWLGVGTSNGPDQVLGGGWRECRGRLPGAGLHRPGRPALVARLEHVPGAAATSAPTLALDGSRHPARRPDDVTPRRRG